MVRERGGNQNPDNQDGMSRRDFLKIIGVGAAATVLGTAGCESVKSVEMNEKKIHDETLAEMLKSPRKKMEVGKWGEGEMDENGDFLPITVSELRDSAGWEKDYEAEFEKALNLFNPKAVSDNHIIQPGFYDVPIKKVAEYQSDCEVFKEEKK